MKKKIEFEMNFNFKTPCFVYTFFKTTTLNYERNMSESESDITTSDSVSFLLYLKAIYLFSFKGLIR